MYSDLSTSVVRSEKKEDGGFSGPKCDGCGCQTLYLLEISYQHGSEFLVCSGCLTRMIEKLNQACLDDCTKIKVDRRTDPEKKLQDAVTALKKIQDGLTSLTTQPLQIINDVLSRKWWYKDGKSCNFSIR